MPVTQTTELSAIALTYWPVLLVSFLVSLVMTPVFRKLALAMNIVDEPDGWLKSHREPIPYCGGVAILLGWLAGVGLAVDQGSIPILPECLAICQATGLDPLGLLASGALIATLPPEDVPRLLSALESKGIVGYEIGQVTDPEEGVKIIAGHELADLPRFDRDELARFFSP